MPALDRVRKLPPHEWPAPARPWPPTHKPPQETSSTKDDETSPASIAIRRRVCAAGCALAHVVSALSTSPAPSAHTPRGSLFGRNWRNLTLSKKAPSSAIQLF